MESSSSTTSSQEQQEPQRDPRRRVAVPSSSSALVSKEEGDWVDSVVNVAQTCKKLFTQHTCRVCQVYTDAQVEYEVRQEQQEYHQHENHNQWIHQFAGGAGLPPPSFEVELYRQFLFDEDSVVEVVNEREREWDDRSLVTQRTQ